MSPARRILGVALLLVGPGCSADGAGPLAPDRPSLPTVTSDTAYDVERDSTGFSVEIPFRFTNTYGAPLFIFGCHVEGRRELAMSLQKLELIVWREVVPAPGPGCAGRALRIDPGEVFADTARVHVCAAVRCGPPAGGMPIEGAYRLVWQNLAATADNRPDGAIVQLPEGFRASTVFELRAP